MKLVALLPFKNEEWILPAYLSSVSSVVDDLVAIDDGSSDGSRRLLERAGAYVVEHGVVSETGYAHHSIRSKLVQLGRERGGTHFLCIDADEALTTPARAHLRDALEALVPGQKLTMQWLTLWKAPDRYRDDDSVWSGLFKDFAFADDGALAHDPAFLHGVGRTPGLNDGTLVRADPDHGAVLHFQFVAWWRAQVKQAWYRCSELIHAPRQAYDINATYAITLDDPNARTSPVPPAWTYEIAIPVKIASLAPAQWHVDDIVRWFDRYGAEFFEPVEIWHVPELHKLFVERVGREPRPVVSLGLGRRIHRAVTAQVGRLRA
jgi:glycosyltransferase involved in cell wall biosynthesis